MINSKFVLIIILLTGLFAKISDRFEIEQVNPTTSKVTFTQESLQYNSIDEYQEIKSSSFSTTHDAGMPELPVHNFLFEIDPNSEVQVSYTILKSHIESDKRIRPYQSVILGQSIDERSDVSANDAFYVSMNIYPLENMMVSEPQIMRDLHVVSVSLIPFIYSPHDETLEVFDEVEILITTIPAKNDDSLTHSTKLSKSFKSVYLNSVLNFNETREEIDTPIILYICGGNSMNSPYLQSLFSWRHQRGYIVNTVPTSITGTSSSAIKNYIQGQYNNPDTRPDFVCLVGDAGGTYNIPTYNENYSGYNGEGDHPYTQLSGNDLLSDVFLGRLPVRSTSDIGVVVNKIINYEKGYDLSSNWTEKAALIGDPSNSGISCAITKEYVADIMEEYGMEDIRMKTSGGSYYSWMQTQLNEGVLYFNYRGYYGVSGFSSSNINNANNGFKLPFATVITCGTGSFSSETVALSEKFMVAGTVSNPKGGIAAIGTATLGTHTLFNNIVDMGVYQGLFVEGNETAGEALVSGKFYLYANYPSNPNNFVSIFSHWNNLMGDPSTHLWTDTPDDLTVTHPETLNWGENLIDILVETSNGEPVNHARVTLLKGSDEIFNNSFTDEFGFVQIPVEFESGGEISITVTKRNVVPYIGTILIPLSGPTLTLNDQEIAIIDDGTLGTSGNGDSILNPGESFIVRLPLYNTGTEAITDLDCQLSFQSELITVISGNANIPNIPGDNMGIADYFCDISASAIDHEALDGSLTISTSLQGSWQYSVPLNVAGANLIINDILVTDNESGLLSPGQTDTLWIALENIGSIPLTNVSASLNVDGDMLIPIENDMYWEYIAAGDTEFSLNPLILEVSDDLINGSVLNLNISIISDDGYDRSKNFQMIAGVQSVNDPLGPDEYGYYIYDSGDTGYDLAPVYNWIEIDSDLGGSGTQLSINDGGNTGDSQVINLPFNFRFYGLDYTQITVCSNGWIALGSSPMESFRNYTIPGAGGPSPMIAVFWDDLKTTDGGEIYSYYDAIQDAFIIEWSAVETYQHGSTESFQAILYNNMAPPFGDNEIKLQYKDFNNTTNGNSGTTHGDYCTIGTEDHTANVGLQYTFNNEYPLPAMQLEDETALLITTQIAQTVPTPELTLNLSELYFEVNLDQLTEDYVTITNSGEPGSTLYYAAELLPMLYPGGTPDNFGHYWSDSAIDPSVEYNWIDISDNNLIVEFTHNDVSSNPVDIGFEFPFYGEFYSQCIISPNGWIGFGEDNVAWQNESIPSENAPRPAIFPFWDDLNPINDGNSPDMEGTVYYQNLGEYFVVWFDHVAHWNGEIQGNYNFQAVLYPTGEIWFNYSDLEGTINRTTIGIQNGDGTDGIQIVVDDDYVQESLSTFIKPSPTWVELYTATGDLYGNLLDSESETITVMVDSEGLFAGMYSSFLKLSTNIEQPLIIPIDLLVTDFTMGDGDLNQDSVINVVDIVIMVNIILGELIPDEFQSWAGDLNGDGLIDVLDIVDIIAIILEQ